jgi:hypothetical protein
MVLVFVDVEIAGSQRHIRSDQHVVPTLFPFMWSKIDLPQRIVTVSDNGINRRKKSCL